MKSRQSRDEVRTTVRIICKAKNKAMRPIFFGFALPCFL
jgi:hypothetical protein